MNVGDRCIGTGFKQNTSMNGMIGTIIGPLEDRLANVPPSHRVDLSYFVQKGYLVKWDGYPDEEIILADCISPLSATDASSGAA